ncbi:MAG: DNA translocase FtsK 4TM domain-containing protein, partial [Candidatus Omnitrophica bacterium]|nr:DNA translocase FtsK 4TM domain-containing protein [Candidatus Omnitrophota bacterium]
MAIRPDRRKERDLFSDKAGTKKKNEILALLLFTLAIFIFISVLTFDYNDLGFFSSTPNQPPHNIAGLVGAYLGCFFVILMGMSSYLIVVLICLAAMAELAGNRPQNFFVKFFGIIFLVLATSSTFSILTKVSASLSFKMGGLIGTSFSNFLIKYLGLVGAIVSILVLLLLSVLVATDFLVFPIIIALFQSTRDRVQKIPSSMPIFKMGREKAKPDRPGTKAVVDIKKKPALKPAGEESPPLGKEEPQVLEKPSPVAAKKTEKGAAKTQSPAEEPVGPKAKEAEPRPYTMPGMDLLKLPPPIEEREIKDDVTENSRILEEILSDFDIAAKVIEVNRGPVITRYELEPGAGVKIHRITSLSDNIALGMKAQSVRIVAPVPGKGTVGVEVPNSKSVMVYLREVLDSDIYKNEESKLKLAIGKDIAGESVVTDLAKMPHLLIAGATGSGKTVCVNSIITSILFNATPDEVKFIMVDPKKVELAPFNNLPYLLCPVVTDYKKVPVALDWLVSEMEKRYELFASCGVRNIDYYNKKARAESWQPLYYIVVIIDELADLIMVAQQEIETTITRMAQLSRA